MNESRAVSQVSSTEHAAPAHRKEDAIALGLLWFAATMTGGLTGAIAFATTPAPISIVGAPESDCDISKRIKKRMPWTERR